MAVYRVLGQLLPALNLTVNYICDLRMDLVQPYLRTYQQDLRYRNRMSALKRCSDLRLTYAIGIVAENVIYQASVAGKAELVAEM